MRRASASKAMCAARERKSSQGRKSRYEPHRRRENNNMNAEKAPGLEPPSFRAIRVKMRKQGMAARPSATADAAPRISSGVVPETSRMDCETDSLMRRMMPK